MINASKTAALAACALVSVTGLCSLPARADGGAMTAYVVRKTAQFVFNFVVGASSNTQADVIALALSLEGLDTKRDSDTGFFSATAEVTARSGLLAQQYALAEAKWHAFSPNEHRLLGSPLLTPPTGIDVDWGGQTKIKGAAQILLAAIPFSPAAPPVSAEVVVPVHLQFDLNEFSSYHFQVGIEFDSGLPAILMVGTAGNTGASVQFPYLETTNPALAATLAAQYLGAVAGSGPVSFDLGAGLLPIGIDGVPGIPFELPLDTPFSLASEFDGTGARSIPEASSFASCLGIGLTIAAKRSRKCIRYQASSAAL